MSIYINKNNQQSGPYEDQIVIDQLRSGQLSPDDMAVKHGGTNWQRLGEMFPDVVPNKQAAADSTVRQGSVTDSTEPAKKAGCRKVLGWGMTVFGLLVMLGCVGAAIVNRTTDPYLCQQADRHAKEAEEAQREVQAAKGTPREGEALRKLMDKNTSFKVSTESCGDMMDYYRWWFIAFLGLGGFGFVTAIVGFFIRRV